MIGSTDDYYWDHSWSGEVVVVVQFGGASWARAAACQLSGALIDLRSAAGLPPFRRHLCRPGSARPQSFGSVAKMAATAEAKLQTTSDNLGTRTFAAKGQASAMSSQSRVGEPAPEAARAEEQR